jgi:hypothetical protein
MSVEAVKKAEKSALNKIRETEQFKTLKEDLNGESVVSEPTSQDDYKIYR